MPMDPLLMDPPLPESFGVSILPAFLSPAEEAELIAASESILPRRFETGHWDGVISGFREATRPISSLAAGGRPAAAAAIARALASFPPTAQPPLASFHALELRADGHIDAHVDSIKFSGSVVAGLCLLSDAVMHLTRAPREEGGAGAGGSGGGSGSDAPISLLLPRRALYILTGEARYEWAHAIPAGAPLFRGVPVTRARRISVMLRDDVPG